MSDEDMLEHITADRVDDRAPILLVNDMHHPGLLLITLGAFIVETVEVESDPRAERKRIHSSHLTCPLQFVVVTVRPHREHQHRAVRGMSRRHTTSRRWWRLQSDQRIRP